MLDDEESTDNELRGKFNQRWNRTPSGDLYKPLRTGTHWKLRPHSVLSFWSLTRSAVSLRGHQLPQRPGQGGAGGPGGEGPLQRPLWHDRPAVQTAERAERRHPLGQPHQDSAGQRGLRGFCSALRPRVHSAAAAALLVQFADFTLCETLITE